MRSFISRSSRAPSVHRTNTKQTLTVGLALVAFLVAGPAASKPAGFSARVDNPWFPLKPGSVYHYRGVKDGLPSREVMTVTHRTRVIDGAPCVVVQDLLYLSGRLEERTTDWYTQDSKGRVWYFGEKTAELDKNGKVKSTAGQVLSMRVSVTAPYISTTHAMLTKEWTPLEPGVLDHKYYVRGIGTVLEQSVKGPVERNELVSFRRGS